MSSSKKKFALNLLVLLGILAVIIYILRHSMGAIFAQLATTSWIVVTGTILAGLIYSLLEGYNVVLLLNKNQEQLTVLNGFNAISYTAFMRVVTFGAGTLIAEAWYYRQKKIDTVTSVGLVSLRMIFNKVALFCWAFLGFIVSGRQFFNQSPTLFYTVLVGLLLNLLIIVAIFALAISLHLQIFTVIVANKLLKSKKWRDRFDDLTLKLFALRVLFKNLLSDYRLLFRLIIFNVFKVTFWLIIPYLVLRPEHPELGFFTSLFYTSFALLLAGVIPTPAGIGGLEFVFTWLFIPLVGRVDAISSLLLLRFANYVLPFLLGMVVAGFLRKNKLQEQVAEIKIEKNA
ncbi:lysylphosphatidylglycerol synthase transmembrane domain-containing protein [Enterococcus timonensis]|uniref:lysylphosphatidylglycerol synthase transmembrane domain-containing protein n=1 Tax=Enterococcus timonensis TaxID=1852364 RepID=UPI0008D98882|nr:lysylphosphatidylglycerol synthase domain-containing protein [Enterococcus timonensis]